MGLLGHFLVFIDFGSKQNLLSNLLENIGFFSCNRLVLLTHNYYSPLKLRL
ncbi:hypothetical protein OIU78_027679 [Salix suchowensis]|nr:hypothetical protein OIU78_027679 [Salix suchowensis]